MPALSKIDTVTLKKLFAMSGGYVLDFSNRTFADFVMYETRRDIYDSKYSIEGRSKASRLRAFWALEPDVVVGKLIRALVKQAEATNSDTVLSEKCLQIATRLEAGTNLDITELSDGEDGDLDVVAEATQRYIDANQPELALDRLHTFTVKFMRRHCTDRGIVATPDKPLHSVVGEYIKALRVSGEITTTMAERILKSSISIFEGFNEVRNMHSLAHDNPLLGQSESYFVVASIVATLKYIRSIEDTRVKMASVATANFTEDDLPF